MFLCLPLMGTRATQALSNPDELSFLERLREEIPGAGIGQHHWECYLETQGRVDVIMALKGEPDNIWNTPLRRRRIWSLIFREMDNMEHLGQRLVRKVQRTKVFAQAVMELEEAQQNGAPEEEISELHHRTSRAWRNLVQLFSIEEIDANVMRFREHVDEDERYREALQRWQAGIERPE